MAEDRVWYKIKPGILILFETTSKNRAKKVLPRNSEYTALIFHYTMVFSWRPSLAMGVNE